MSDRIDYLELEIKHLNIKLDELMEKRSLECACNIAKEIQDKQYELSLIEKFKNFIKRGLR